MLYTYVTMNIKQLTDFIGVTNTAANKPVEPEQKEFERENLGPKKVYIKWTNKHKVEKKALNSRYNRTLMIIGLVVGFLLVLMQEFFIILAIMSIFFVKHAIETAPEEEFSYEISSHGIKVSDSFYYWDELEKFFVSTKFGNEYIAVDIKDGFPARTYLYYKNSDRDKIIDSLNKHITYIEKEPLTITDRAYLSVMDRFDFSEDPK